MNALTERDAQLLSTLQAIATVSAVIGDHGDALQPAHLTELRGLLTSLLDVAKGLVP